MSGCVWEHTGWDDFISSRRFYWEETETRRAVNQRGRRQMQKSEFADHLVLKCQFQSVLFADRLKITRNPFGNCRRHRPNDSGKVFFFCQGRHSKCVRGTTPPKIQMNKITIIQIKERDFLPEKKKNKKNQ